MRSCTGISTSVRSSPPRALYFCVLPCGASLTGLCAVRAYKDFVLRCTVRAPRAFVRCEPTKALYSVRRGLCFCVLCEPSRGASLQRLCASVYRTSARSFARCEPTKALCLCVPYERQELCAVRASKGFVPLCAVGASRALCGASLQRLSTVCWCSPLKICYVLVYKNLYICTVCTSSHDISCSVREPVCLYVAERSIHVD